MRIKSNEARRILADHLKEHDPEMLKAFTLLSQKFGKAVEIEIEEVAESDLLLEKLKAARDAHTA